MTENSALWRVLRRHREQIVVLTAGMPAEVAREYLHEVDSGIAELEAIESGLAESEAVKQELGAVRRVLMQGRRAADQREAALGAALHAADELLKPHESHQVDIRIPRVEVVRVRRVIRDALASELPRTNQDVDSLEAKLRDGLDAQSPWALLSKAREGLQDALTIVAAMPYAARYSSTRSDALAIRLRKLIEELAAAEATRSTAARRSARQAPPDVLLREISEGLQRIADWPRTLDAHVRATAAGLLADFVVLLDEVRERLEGFVGAVPHELKRARWPSVSRHEFEDGKPVHVDGCPGCAARALLADLEAGPRTLLDSRG